MEPGTILIAPYRDDCNGESYDGTQCHRKLELPRELSDHDSRRPIALYREEAIETNAGNENGYTAVVNSVWQAGRVPSAAICCYGLVRIFASHCL